MTVYFPHDEVPNYDFGTFKLSDVEQKQRYYVKDESLNVSVWANTFGEASDIVHRWMAAGVECVSFTKWTDGEQRVLSPKAIELLTMITRHASGRISEITLFRGFYSTLTNGNINIKDAKHILEFFWDNYEGMN